MSPVEEVDYILHDCLFAVGQGVGTDKIVDDAALAWLRSRYRDKFLVVMTSHGNSWARDRHRVTAVSRYLGQRAAHHAGDRGRIDVESIARAAAEIESGCRMNAERESGLPLA